MPGDLGAYRKSMAPEERLPRPGVARERREPAMALAQGAVQRQGGDVLGLEMLGAGGAGPAPAASGG